MNLLLGRTRSRHPTAAGQKEGREYYNASKKTHASVILVGVSSTRRGVVIRYRSAHKIIPLKWLLSSFGAVSLFLRSGKFIVDIRLYGMENCIVLQGECRL